MNEPLPSRADAVAHRREALRQTLLMQALLRPAALAAPPVALQGWLRETGERAAQGLAAYRAHAGSVAERALATAFPTVFALVGASAAGALARAYRQAHPPLHGDLAWLGQALPGFLEADPQLADEPYLADVARLELALARAESAADVAHDRASLMRLASEAAACLRLRLAAGSAVLDSRYPIATLHAAHQWPPGDQRSAAFGAARAALAAGRGESAWVWRDAAGRPRVMPVDGPAAALLRATLGGASLATALQTAGPGLDFGAWLAQALEHEGLAAIDDHPDAAAVAASPA